MCQRDAREVRRGDLGDTDRQHVRDRQHQRPGAHREAEEAPRHRAVGNGLRHQNKAVQAPVPGDEGKGRIQQQVSVQADGLRRRNRGRGRRGGGDSQDTERREREGQRRDRHAPGIAVQDEGKAGTPPASEHVSAAIVRRWRNDTEGPKHAAGAIPRMRILRPARIPRKEGESAEERRLRRDIL